MASPFAVSFDSRPLTTQPSVVEPGGLGQESPQRGAVPPDRGVVRVGHVDEGPLGEIGVERHTEQPAIPPALHLRRQVGERGRRGVGEVVVDLDPAGLLGNEDPPVLGESDRRRLGQAADRGRLLEARRGSGLGGAGRDGERGGAGERQQGPANPFAEG
jgi:hypothetical protein